MTKVLQGTVHGRMIELTEDLGLTDGQAVEVHITIRSSSEQSGAGLLRTAGALADDPQWDTVMKEIHRQRQLERRPAPEGE